MTRKTLLTDIRNNTRRAYDDIYVLTLKILEWEDKLEGNKYSHEYKDSVIQPEIKKLKREREALRENAVKNARELARKYMDEQARLDELRGDQITDDARLLTCGVKLKVDELEKLFDRNAGNGTMQQIIWRYAQDHGMGREFRRVYQPHSTNCVNLDHDLSYQVDVALKYYNQKESYKKIAGDGGLFDQQIASAE